MNKFPNIVVNTSPGIKNMPSPEIGMGATKYSGSDRYPYTVTEIVAPKTIKVKANDYRADPDKEGGMGHQNWIIDEDPRENAEELTLTLRKDGYWYVKGQEMGYGRFILGERSYYYRWEF